MVDDAKEFSSEECVTINFTACAKKQAARHLFIAAPVITNTPAKGKGTNQRVSKI